ncbi:cyclase family protein [Dacryopinax primogenitus]|uniref:Cyclase family protein n=1 Tax=Dacryopinax primogenitus (strain DJM 731) TaxID=1858805 RepID=M5GET8_DACPD|nr:cyclase family protein [Dacryopinax primogenitus]EJU05672.1 cyclase family protein [Dacryopinax primogenitus]
MKDIVDLSHPMQMGMQIYPGDPKFICYPAAELSRNGYNVQRLQMGSHTGTHVDVPYHFFADGKKIDELPIELFVGRAAALDMSYKGAKGKINWEDMAIFEDLLKPGNIVLIRTGWSQYWGQNEYFDHPYLTRAAAVEILKRGVKVIGVDTLSPDATLDGAGDFGVHDEVLGSGGVIVENLNNLAAIQEGEWMVSLVPLRLAGCDGSPVRAFAWKQ